MGAGASDSAGAKVSTMASGMDALVLEAMNYAAAHGVLSRRKDGVPFGKVDIAARLLAAGDRAPFGVLPRGQCGGGAGHDPFVEYEAAD